MPENATMEDLHHNHDNLPVLTEIVRPQSQALGNPGKSVVNMQLAIIEADPRGYDPYNHAPPVPVNEEVCGSN